MRLAYSQSSSLKVDPSNFSQGLAKATLKGSPSLLWLAAEWGNTEVFQLLLNGLEPFEKMEAPERIPGVATITQIALSKGHLGILEKALQEPSLFPR